MTKNQIKAKYQQYLKSSLRYVADVYVRPSVNKCIAERNILNYMMNNDGYGYRVMSHNNSFFTAGYIIRNEKGKCFVYETAYNQYVLPIDT